MNKVIVRFPPSPTGFLHIGNARIALANWFFAKKMKGEVILRFDDTDIERVKPEFKTQLKEDLHFLGISFDKFFEQSGRETIYEEAFQRLIQEKLVYPCYETEEELEIKRKLSLSKGKPPRYTFSEFTAEEKKRPPYFRFRLDEGQVSWNDIVQGEMSFWGKDLSDPVIRRANGNFMYTFCSIVDDFLMEISHIIRGADHITNTAIQIQIFNSLCKVFKREKTLDFAHLPLFQSKEGKISKRIGGFSIIEMKKTGFEALAIINVLSKIGLSYYDDKFKSIDELIEDFDLTKFNKAQITFDSEMLKVFNSKYLSHVSYEDIKERLPITVTKEFFEQIKPNVCFLHEIPNWYNILYDESLDFSPYISSTDKPFIHILYTKIENLSEITWESLQKICKENFPGRKGKALFLPIRLALTGIESGPQMQFIVENIKLDIIKKRFLFASN